MKLLEDKGYKCWKTEHDSFGTTKQWQRRVDLDEGFDYPLCQLNDKLLINVVEHDLTFHGNRSHSFSLDITAENEQADWCDIKIYGIKLESLEENLDTFEKKLLNMWKAFNES